MAKTIDIRKLKSAQQSRMIVGGGLFPEMVATAPNTLLAVVRKGAGHCEPEDKLGSGHIIALQSLDRGLTWNQISVVANSDFDDHNPAIGISRSGIVVVTYWKFDTSRKRPPQTYVTRSKDGGKTWEEPYPFSCESLYGHSSFGKIITLQDGTMMVAIYTMFRCMGNDPIPILPGDIAGEKSGTSCYIARSYDEGLTWTDAQRLSPVLGDGFGETGLLALPNGDIIAAMRNEDEDVPGNQHYIGVMRSTDGGRTWSKPQQVTKTLEHPADMVVLSNGYILMVFGTRNQPKGVQGIISIDGGKTWETEKRLVFADDLPRRDPDRIFNWPYNGGCDCGYPTVTRLEDGHIVVAFYDNLLRQALEDEGLAAAAYCISFNESELLKAWELL